MRYLCNSRPDICFAVSIIRRFMNDPMKSHLTAAKIIMRYVKGTLKFGLLLTIDSKEGKAKLEGYSDSDWCTKKKPVNALSSCEAEYIADTFAACQAIWLDNVMKELNCEVEKPLKLKIDNRSTINLAKNPITHGRRKHIETRFHFIREQVTKGMIEVVYCPTEAQLADGFTKALKIDKFSYFRDKLGLIEC